MNTGEDKRVVLPKNLKLYIDGEWCDSVSGLTFPVISPQNASVICSVPEGSKEDVEKAVKAARKAMTGEWAKIGPSGRRNLLLKLADALESDISSFGVLESYNNGGPLAFQGPVVGVIPDDIRYYAGWADKVDGKVPNISPDFHAYSRKEPIGVCGLILPWNVPLWSLVTKLGPCLAMGNTAVIKPAEQTPLTALKFMECVEKVGFPKGVVNVVTGHGATGAALSSHMDVDKISFTGSTDVGRLVMKASADSNLKKVQLELGGKSPLVVFGDANVDEAVEIASSAIFTNNGELCTVGSRTFVHAKIYDEFVAKATKKAKEIKVGPQLDNSLGPVVDRDQFDRILSLVDAGKREGAKLECGGGKQGDTGFFVQPTVFSNVTDEMTIAREEIFGPVQSILKFETVEEVVRRANATQYGLAAGVITKDINNVFAISNNVKAGTIWVNTYLPVFPQCEFGGYKQSGFGREGGAEGILEWTQTKTVMIKISSKL